MLKEFSYSNPINKISDDLIIAKSGTLAVIELLKEGATVPFIARYRKEATGGLDEVQIRAIGERYEYEKELDERKKTILQSIESQGKLTKELKEKVIASETKTVLEDLYLPYKPKRRTRATIAKEKGLEPLAELIVEQSNTSDPLKDAEKFLNLEKGVTTVEEALAGACDIVAEKVSEDVNVRKYIRECFQKEGIVRSMVKEEYKEQTTKYNDYYEFSEMVSKIPSHRYLAIRRGEREGVLTFKIEILEEENIKELEKLLLVKKSSPYAKHYSLAIKDAFRRLILPSVETDIRVKLKMEADKAAVTIFAENLKHLLLASPLGNLPVIGIDPGIRTGCKCAVVDQTGKFLENATLYISQGGSKKEQAKQILLALVKKYSPYAIAVGNGTAGRETEVFVKETLKESQQKGVIVVQVNESGASVYSASDVAREEFPDLDLTIRGAISIARRLQDPLAELVKIDPKAIGVGQYQHDVYQQLLTEKLQDVVESCVNFVGVELNTASPALLSYVSGIGSSMAKKIVTTREEFGKFSNRKQLLKVPGLGNKTFEQSAGFLRIRDGENPLDRSAVHPESYKVVEKMAKDSSLPVSELIGNEQAISSLVVNNYQTDEVGMHTLQDIIAELKKPGRDPRSCFAPPNFRDDVQTMNDLSLGMALEGVVTNVTAFGAFVDIGVHQDGLIHVSELSDQFITDPHQVVKAGDRLKVKVLEVDLPRKRISLTAKTGARINMEKKKAKAPIQKAKKNFNTSPFSNL